MKSNMNLICAHAHYFTIIHDSLLWEMFRLYFSVLPYQNVENAALLNKLILYV